MRHFIAISIFTLSSLVHAQSIKPLGDVKGYIIENLETQHPFELIEGTLTNCVLNTGLPTLKIHVCDILGGEITINGNTFSLTKLVRNFHPNASPSDRAVYQYQYIGIWERKLPDLTLRYKMVVTMNLPGLNTPRFQGFISVGDLAYSRQLVAKKS